MGYLSIAGILLIIMVIGIAVHRMFRAEAAELSKKLGRDVSTHPGGAITTTIAFAVLIALTLVMSVHQIPTGHVGVVSEFRSIVGQTGEGLQFVPPWRSVQNEKIQLSSKVFEFDKPDTAAASKQSQDVYARVTLNFRVSPEKILHLHRTVGPDWFETVVAPRVAQIFKAFTVSYDTKDVLPNREEIRAKAADLLRNQLAAYSIENVDLLITNIGFSDEYQKEIEATAAQMQIASRETEKVQVAIAQASQKIETARGEAQSILVVATSQAEANTKLAKSITPELVQYQMMTKLAPNVQVMMIPTGQQFIMSPEMIRPTTAAARQ